ncbi:MAG: acyl-ACP--UDP-N-acetylglucosamine O-acyltransferase [Hydrogenobaculum sp.]|jgi:UDP-N-acetylglucosamine acyltransferase
MKTSIISPKAEIGLNVEIGEFCIIEDDVKIGNNVKIKNKVLIRKGTIIKDNVKIYDGAIIGEDPQHLKDNGEGSIVEIGENTIIREYVTIHRGTTFDKKKTTIGANVFLMAYTHVAHDCVVKDGVIMANCATLGGHVEVGEYAFIGGLSAAHQHTKIGAYAMVGGLSGVSLDIPPFVKAAGPHAKLFGINTIGLERRGFSKEDIEIIKHVYKIIFRSQKLKKDAIEEVLSLYKDNKYALMFVDFIKNSKRGVAREER